MPNCEVKDCLKPAVWAFHSEERNPGCTVSGPFHVCCDCSDKILAKDDWFQYIRAWGLNRVVEVNRGAGCWDIATRSE